MNNLLIVSTDRILQQTLYGFLSGHCGFLNILTAGNYSEATRILRENKIRLVITTVRFSEIDGFKVIYHLVKIYPSIRVVVVTDETHPILLAKIKQLPSTVFFDRNQDFRLLVKRILDELQINYGGQIRGIHLTSFLQIMEIEAHSCTLQIKAKEKKGYLWLKKGKLIAARTDSLNGKSAAIEILSWKNVMIDIDYRLRNIQQEISSSLMSLILDSSLKDDENESLRINRRTHERRQLLVIVDYETENITRQCSLCDISLKGAYLETDHPLEIGQTISLHFPSPELAKPQALKATVIRKNQRGIGIQFQNKSDNFEKILQPIIDGYVSQARPQTGFAGLV
jgi:CheY-like chemotaxis protein